MTTMLAFLKQNGLRVCSWLAVGALAVGAAAAQAPAARITAEISVSDVTPLQNSPRLFAETGIDAGRMPADTRLTGITMVFNRTAAQEADLKALLAAQQNPSSPLFHKWLTPEQFGARFGMAEGDLAKVEQWLQQQGFTIDSVGRSRNSIRFDGTVNQVELAFQTQMHYYKTSDGVQHISPATRLSVPSAFASTIESIRNLTDLRPRSMHVPVSRSAHPDYTFNSNGTQYVLFAPGDIEVAYDIKSLLTAGDNGSGQTIAVMGQSEISTTDITNFQDAAGLAEKAPNIILVPNTGSAAFMSGDEGESDLDLEWSGAMAPGATIDFVYAGNSTTSNGVFDSIAYAVDSKLGDIITVSYGSCEPELVMAGFNQDSVYEQAASQGQSIIASSGDSGSTACFGFTDLTTAVQQELAVNYPASSQYVTGVGGTEITAANDAVGTYWSSASNNSVVLTTAQSYIPEVAWNDDATSGAISPANGGGLSAGGGGVSTLYTTQPTWQASYFTATGETNPNSSARLVPDVALYSSPEYPGYLYCTSDTSDWQLPAQKGSCGNSQFYDPTSGYFTIAGGTSFAAPIFAGMVAILNQKAGYTAGQGLLNSSLYSLASNSTTYASAFHDVTSGNNDCTAGTTYGYCSSSGSTEGYAAGTGYDLVTGLGSVDLANLVAAWPASTSTLIGTTTTLSAANTSPNVNVADNITISVASDAPSTTIPTGTVAVSVNGGTATNYTLTSNGTYVDPLTFTSAGTYSIVAQYMGDATHAASSGALSVTVGGTSSGKGSFGLTATNISVSQGSSGGSTVTVTPSGGYTGTVTFNVTTTSTALQTYGCYNVNNATVSGTSPVTTTVSVYTSSADCSGTASRKHANLHRFTGRAVAPSHPAPTPSKTLPIGLGALAGVLLLGMRRRAKWITTLGCLLLLAGAGLAIGCGSSSSSSSTSNDVPTGTYTLSVVGTDSMTSTITANTSFTLTVD